MDERYEWLAMAGFQWERYERYVVEGDEVRGEGGRWPVSPDKEAPLAHREFLNVQGGGDEALKRFALLYGLPGTAGDGATHRDSRNAIWAAVSSMNIYAGFAHDQPSVPMEEKARTFNDRAPRHLAVALELPGNRPVLRIRPTSLLMWMWLRLAQEKTGALPMKTCRECNQPFLIGPGYRRRDALYCSEEHKIDALNRARSKASTKGART